MHYIYALHAGDRDYKYVGRTKNPAERLARHKRTIKQHPDWSIYRWMATVSDVQMEVIATCDTLQEAKDAEVQSMARLESEGFSLVNAYGRAGVRESSIEVRTKNAESHRGERNHAFGKPAHNRGRTSSDATKAKLSAARTGIPGTRPTLTEDQVREIRALQGCETARAVAPRFGVSFQSIHNIWAGKTWSWLA